MSSPEEKARDLSDQWAAVSFLILNKDANVSTSKLRGNLVNITIKNPGMKKHINNIVEKYGTMNIDDIRLYLGCIQRLVETIVGVNTIPIIFENSLQCLYEATVIATQIYNENEKISERTLVTPEIQIPDVFFNYLEEAFKWILYLLDKISYHEYWRLHTSVLPYFYDFLLHSPPNIGERYEGKILSLLSIENEWNKSISDRIRQMCNNIKKDNYKKSLLLFLKAVDHICYDFTVVDQRARIMNELIEWANFSMKISDDDVNIQMISFSIGSMMACDWDPTLPQDLGTREMFKKLIETTFKLAKSNKNDPTFIDLATRSVSLVNSSLFDSYWKKLSGIIEDHFKKHAKPESFKSLALVVQLFCGKFINGEMLMRFVTEIIYEKGKNYVLNKKLEQFEDSIRDFFIEFSAIEPSVVCNYINNIQKVLIAANDLGPRTQYMLEITAKVRTNNEALIKGLLAPIEPKLEVYLGPGAPPGITKSCLPLLVNMWCLIPRARPGISSIVQKLVDHLDLSIASQTFEVFVEMMSNASAEDFPIQIAFVMPRAVFRQLIPNINTKTFLSQVKYIYEYVLVLTKIFKGKPESISNEWEQLNKKLDIALFPFLFHTEPLIVRLVRNIYAVLASNVNFYCVAQWFASSRGRPLISSLRQAITQRPEWFAEVSNRALNFWRELATGSNIGFVINLSEVLSVIITPETENLKYFFHDLLEMFVRFGDLKILPQCLMMLSPTTWDTFFAEFNNFYASHIEDQRLLCLQIQMLFASNRHFVRFNPELRESFYTTLKNYFVSKRARFEREIPFEIISLNICNTISRVDKEIIPKLCEEIGGSSELIKKLMNRINPKEIFVVNTNRIIAHLDMMSAVLSQVKVEVNDVATVLSYLLTIADKSMEYKEILDVIADCINQMFTVNEDARTLIINTAISFKNTLLSEIGKAILLNAREENSNAKKTQLADELVLATSLFSATSVASHTVGLNLARAALEKLAGDDEEVKKAFANPLFNYDPHCEEYVWALMDKYMGDEEMQQFVDLMANVSQNIPKRAQQPVITHTVLNMYKENPSTRVVTNLFSYLSSNDFTDFNQITPILNACDEIFAKCEEIDIQEICQMLLGGSDTSQSHLNAAVYMFQSMFKCRPGEVSQFILSNMEFLNDLKNPATWNEINSNIPKYARITSILSYILAMNNDVERTREYFGKIAPRLLLYALHIFERKEFRMALFPPLLLSLLHSFSPQRKLLIFTNIDQHLSPAQCQFANDVIEEFDPEAAREFRRIIIPVRADGQEMNLNFVHAISPRFGAHDIAMLLSVVAEYATKDNVGTVLRFLPSLVSALPAVAPPNTLAHFIMFMISFMFDNGDPRIILAIAENGPVLVQALQEHGKYEEVSKNLTELINAAGGVKMVMSVILEPLALADTLTGPLYAACVDFLILINGMIAGEDESKLTIVDMIIIILDALWNISGVRGRRYKSRKTGWVNGCHSIIDLAKFAKTVLTDSSELKTICQFLLQLTANMVIQDDKFRLNTVTLFSRLVEDIEVITSMENVGDFLLVSAVCSDEMISSKYASLLGQLINREMNFACDFISVMGPTLVHNDQDNMTIIRSISPDFYPALSVVARPPVLSSFISELVFNQ